MMALPSLTSRSDYSARTLNIESIYFFILKMLFLNFLVNTCQTKEKKPDQKKKIICVKAGHIHK